MEFRSLWLGRQIGNLALNAHFRPHQATEPPTPSGFKREELPRRLGGGQVIDRHNLFWLRRDDGPRSNAKRSLVILVPPKDSDAASLLSSATLLDTLTQRYPGCDLLFMDYTSPGQTPTSLHTLARATQATLRTAQQGGYHPHNTHVVGYSMGNAALIRALTSPPPPNLAFKTSGLGVLSVSGFGSLNAAFMGMIARVPLFTTQLADQPTWLGRCLRALAAPLVHDLLNWGGWGDDLAQAWHDLPKDVRLEGVVHCKHDRVVHLSESLLTQRKRPRTYTAYGLRRVLTALVVVLLSPCLLLIALPTLAIAQAMTLRDLKRLMGSSPRDEETIAEKRAKQHQLGSIMALICVSILWALLQPLHPEVWGAAFLPGNRLIAAKRRGPGTRFVILFASGMLLPVAAVNLFTTIQKHGLHLGPWLLLSIALTFLTVEAARVLCVFPRRHSPTTLQPGPDNLCDLRSGISWTGEHNHHCLLEAPADWYVDAPSASKPRPDQPRDLLLRPRG